MNKRFNENETLMNSINRLLSLPNSTQQVQAGGQEQSGASKKRKSLEQC